jgi:hypothetical protein
VLGGSEDGRSLTFRITEYDPLWEVKRDSTS